MNRVAEGECQIDPCPDCSSGERWGEPVQRIGDAIDAVKVLNGEPSYIG